MPEKELKKRQALHAAIGDFVENKIEDQIVRRYEAPILEGDPENRVWYRIPIPEGMSGDGSGYHIYIKKAESEHLCVFLSGGGVAWNEYTAARPVTGGKVAAGMPNYYWNNLRPFTQIMNINKGITETGNAGNPFDDWNFIIITYATGDFHVGRNDYPYDGEDGSSQVLHFHGYENFRAGMDAGTEYFHQPDKLLIAGDSAGAFAVPALAGEIVEDYFPECEKVSLLSDSGQLLYRRWKTTARDLWKAKECIWKPIRSSNLTVDWYHALYKRLGDRVNYLYAGSPHDYLLSAYYNDVVNQTYKTDSAVQEIYFRQMKDMLKNLVEITPSFHFFIYDFRNLFLLRGGTVHTAVRQKWFYYRTRTGDTMAQWLDQAVNGEAVNSGLELMDSEKKILRRYPLHID